MINDRPVQSAREYQTLRDNQRTQKKSLFSTIAMLGAILLVVVVFMVLDQFESNHNAANDNVNTGPVTSAPQA